jgi:hypothetical protein
MGMAGLLSGSGVERELDHDHGGDIKYIII